MQRIVIKNFGVVKDADIELKKITVLIGEQASGKSTIAKLVYYFKTLRDDFLREFHSRIVKKEEKSIDFYRICKEKFYNLFGSITYLPKFEVYYYTSEERYILLTSENKELQVFFAEKIPMNILLEYTSEKVEWLVNNPKLKRDFAFMLEQMNMYDDYSDLLNEVFENKQSYFTYIIAGRNATVSYSELFEKYLFANVQNKVLENSKLSYSKKRYNVDEVLMLEFMKQTSFIKEYFEEYGNFDNLIDYNLDAEDSAKIVLEQINKIIKGKYIIDENGEKIIYDNQEDNYVLLSNASSGQQEVIRILQDIFINIIEERKVFRVVEEPEAHLFPSAQKQLIELLTFLMNQNEDNQIIITTHSPYVLTVFNNLIFSKRITDKNPDANNEINEIIQKEFWIDSDDFSAYNLGKTDDSERKAQSIINEKTGLIEQNYLDEVSEKLGNDFQKLYSIHQKSFSRR
ncbi:AAA family ATPase [Bernardetia sp. Wsw4-3y2]|uniref:AAA family ATPase n=1 Tax=Bernardetia sp. Wsw4-3y2 TaxID=3127471 RepID=UPI0030CCB366